ncbi:hypothetical protein BCR37DRAFT_390810 [Protomyces lactucae-debilis]|uniref:Uncharacterized protein n=1 Tax=Protomyces lactucae-debilis TaxID=2754530 RepID=A0A1Y2FSW9_PROLT|nr:uncharacterized protein BCR37DRAFT_390810 [Protomyces lactucae-debilis]ORY87101.1 hypothetical protein BCR37DRAFT_390810 [Protomyces lactucae-debilis]
MEDETQYVPSGTNHDPPPEAALTRDLPSSPPTTQHNLPMKRKYSERKRVFVDPVDEERDEEEEKVPMPLEAFRTVINILHHVNTTCENSNLPFPWEPLPDWDSVINTFRDSVKRVKAANPPVMVEKSKLDVIDTLINPSKTEHAVAMLGEQIQKLDKKISETNSIVKRAEAQQEMRAQISTPSTDRQNKLFTDAVAAGVSAMGTKKASNKTTPVANRATATKKTAKAQKPEPVTITFSTGLKELSIAQRFKLKLKINNAMPKIKSKQLGVSSLRVSTRGNLVLQPSQGTMAEELVETKDQWLKALEEQDCQEVIINKPQYKVVVHGVPLEWEDVDPFDSVQEELRESNQFTSSHKPRWLASKSSPDAKQQEMYQAQRGEGGVDYDQEEGTPLVYD